MKKSPVSKPTFSRPDLLKPERRHDQLIEKRHEQMINQLIDLLADSKKQSLEEAYGESIRVIAAAVLEDYGWDVGDAFASFYERKGTRRRETPETEEFGPFAFSFVRIAVQCPTTVDQDCGALVVLAYLRRYADERPGGMRHEDLSYSHLIQEMMGMRKVKRISIERVLDTLRTYFPNKNAYVFVRKVDPVSGANKLVVHQSFPAFGGQDPATIKDPLSIHTFIYFEKGEDGGQFSIIEVGVYENLPPIRTPLKAQIFMGQVITAFSEFVRTKQEPVTQIIKFEPQDLGKSYQIAKPTFSHPRDESPKRKAKTHTPKYEPAPPPPKEESVEEEEEAEEDEEEAEEEADEDAQADDFFTEEGLIDELEEEDVEMTKKYFYLWQAMKNPDTTWEGHLYELYLDHAKKSVPKTLELMREELRREQESHKPGKPKYWRLDAPLAETFSELSVGTVCVVCLESECSGKHKV